MLCVLRDVWDHRRGAPKTEPTVGEANIHVDGAANADDRARLGPPNQIGERIEQLQERHQRLIVERTRGSTAQEPDQARAGAVHRAHLETAAPDPEVAQDQTHAVDEGTARGRSSESR